MRGLSFVTVESSLFTKEVHWKNVETSRNGSALVVRGRLIAKRGKGKDRNQSLSKSRACSNVECYHYHKKVHLKKDCYRWKCEKGKGKKQDKNQKEDKKTSNNVNIEEVNAVSECEEGDILFTSTMDSVHLVVTNQGMSHDWVLDSGASFHVSPNREWFTNYDARRIGNVRLGNGLACDIVGVGDVQMVPHSFYMMLDMVRYLRRTWSVQGSYDAGYTCTFGDCSWKISKGALHIA